MYKQINYIILILLLAILVGCGPNNNNGNGPSINPPLTIKPPVALPYVVPMVSKDWVEHFNNSSGVSYGTAKPLLPIADGLSEIFPTKESGRRFNYLCSPQHGANLSQANSLSMTVRTEVVTGAPTFDYLSKTNNCSGPACDPSSARLMIFGPPGNLVSTTDRWWADVAIPLTAPLGVTSITVPLDGSHWVGVLGQSAATTGAKAFLNSKKQVNWLCLTFGGGFYFGHGLDTINGTAEFDLLNYEAD